MNKCKQSKHKPGFIDFIKFDFKFKDRYYYCTCAMGQCKCQESEETVKLSRRWAYIAIILYAGFIALYVDSIPGAAKFVISFIGCLLSMFLLEFIHWKVALFVPVADEPHEK